MLGSPRKSAVEHFVLYIQDYCTDRIAAQWRWGHRESRGPGQWWIVLPWQTAALHMIGQGHVVAPHIELPFPQTEHSAQHVPRVNSYPHVDVKAGGLADKPARQIHFEITPLPCTFIQSHHAKLVKLYDLEFCLLSNGRIGAKVSQICNAKYGREKKNYAFI